MTVVILKENMRQKSQTKADKKLRAALENMCYKDCTEDDIEFLRTHIVGSKDPAPQLNDPKFRNVSIITARNIHKDKLNMMGSLCFAADSGQELTHFYSVDQLNSVSNSNQSKKIKAMGKKKKIRNGIQKKKQIALWNAPPSTSEHIAGKLSLCIGLPVMLRHNDATELCITKRQEGIVVGWDSSIGKHDRLTLETLFIELINPPKNINLEGLPENVVPVSKSTTAVTC